jgi:hypothetical protein
VSEAARPSAPPAPSTSPRHDDEPEDRASTGDDADTTTADRSADPTDDGTDDRGAGDDTADGSTPDDRSGPTDDATDDSGGSGSGTHGSGTGADDVTDGDVGEELVTRGD